MRLRRSEAETELILISGAVARLKVGMYGGLPEPQPVASIKAKIKRGEARPSIGWQPQNEVATKCIHDAIVQGELSVFLRPAGTAGELHQMPLQVPLEVLTQMITTRGGLPDYTIGAERMFANSSIAPELFAALLKSPLSLHLKDFEAWYEDARAKNNWPSQRPHCRTPPSLRSRSKKNPIGRPSKQINLQTLIASLVNAGRWSAEQNFIADLVRLLASQGARASRQSVQRAVIQLHRETGDYRYHCVDPRKQPDESVWRTFEDLAERRRRQHQK